jgi:hypothetical protein
MPQLPSEWLSSIGVAKFALSGIGDIALYARQWAEIRGEEATQEKSFRAFIEFGAVEFALAPLYRGSLPIGGDLILKDLQPPELVFPVNVPDSAIADAIYETDCGPFFEHRTKAASQLRPWDVLAFAGDMSKLELLGLSDDINMLSDPKTMQGAIENLASRYARAGLGSRVVESRLLAAQGLIWFSKLALLRGEDYTETHDLPFAANFFDGTATA